MLPFVSASFFNRDGKEQYRLQVGKEPKNVEILLMSGLRMKQEIDGPVVAVSAGMWMLFVLVKRDMTKAADLRVHLHSYPHLWS